VTLVAVWLAAIGLSDIVADLSGRPRNPIRIVAGWAAATLGSLALARGYGFPWAVSLVLTIFVSLSALAWLAARAVPWTPVGAALILWAFGVVGLGVTMAGRTIDGPDGGLILESLRDLGLGGSIVGTPPALALLVGALLVMQATANSVVRLILTAVGADFEAAEEKLRGGRIIGPLERSLVFGFTVAGEPTAAVLVISAKSLLRFPEISTSDKTRIDTVTEYFLVGSMASWIVAFGAGALVRWIASSMGG
jgi:hypothetical protein